MGDAMTADWGDVLGAGLRQRASFALADIKREQEQLSALSQSFGVGGVPRDGAIAFACSGANACVAIAPSIACLQLSLALLRLQ